MESTADLIAGQIREDQDAWKSDHAEAMACRDVEDLLRKGLRLFKLLRVADETWSEKIETGAARFDERRVRAIRQAYEWWLAPCDSVLRRVEKMEQKFGVVDGAEDFRKARLLAKDLVSIPVETIIRAMKDAA